VTIAALDDGRAGVFGAASRRGLWGGMGIRPVRAGEALAGARVHVQADAETYRPIFGARFRAVPINESLARWEAALAAGDVFLAAEEEGAIVGLAHAHGDWMSALYLLASHQRRGLGLALLSELCTAVRARGVTEIHFDCVATNENAIAFYEAMGSRRTGRRTEGEGADAWEEILFALATDRPAALRRA
jgi:GNAT superfamily N-acetyltransferase